MSKQGKKAAWLPHSGGRELICREAKPERGSFMFVDTHAHLDFPELSSDLVSVLARAQGVGVRTIITVGIDLPSSRRAKALSENHTRMFSTVGIHPHGAHRLDQEEIDALVNIAKGPRVIAIGEIGLDYYRNRQPRPVQRECFRQQLELACELRMPAVFHVRDAYEDFLETAGQSSLALRGGVLHCFSGDWHVARRCLDLGFYLSIPGTVTFPKSEILQEVVMRAPLDRLLLETDAPFLAPVPYRGKTNEPSYLVHTAKKVADLRGCPLEELAAQTSANATRAFGLDLVED
jgi:TatD DNase family protein